MALSIKHYRGSSDVVRVGSCIFLGRILGFQAGYRILIAAYGKLVSFNTGCTMISSVIRCGCAVCFYGYLILRTTVRYTQGSFTLCDGVVGFLRVCFQGIAECVCAASYQGLASGEVISCSLTFCKSCLSLQCGLSVYKCGSVILLVQIGTL